MRGLAALLAVVCLLLAPLPVAGGQQAQVTELVVSNSTSHLLVYATVAGAFSPEMEEALASGLPVTFTFFVELTRVEPHWPDRTVAERRFAHLLTYDPLTQEYTVRREEEGGQVRVTRDLAQAERWMQRVTELPLVELDRLAAGVDYRLRLRARLDEKTLPFNLHYLLPFLSLWDFETPWQSLVFRY